MLAYENCILGFPIFRVSNFNLGLFDIEQIFFGTLASYVVAAMVVNTYTFINL